MTDLIEVVKKELEKAKKDVEHSKARLELIDSNDEMEMGLSKGRKEHVASLERILADYKKTEAKLLEAHVASIIETGICDYGGIKDLRQRCLEVAKKVIEFLKDDGAKPHEWNVEDSDYWKRVK